MDKIYVDIRQQVWYNGDSQDRRVSKLMPYPTDRLGILRYILNEYTGKPWFTPGTVCYVLLHDNPIYIEHNPTSLYDRPGLSSPIHHNDNWYPELWYD